MEAAAAAAGTQKGSQPTAADGRRDAATAEEATSFSFSSVAATAASLVAVGLGGAALLVWWALAFHPAHARLWMVPAGLVLLGTPIVAWLSLFASDPCRRGRAAPSPPGALVAAIA